ncbi:hypothetical protein [Cupriavidus sp. 2SB]|uniref:hypothetical protein n=1 Tax=Cupriavidus sp. 2SB TaxID=2502199 RepID=UPI0010F7A070|nr:hypothetical protein [Cupriavidus sp. 2SB]
MKIKFKAPDPRAGAVVQLDSSRAQHFIDTGAAVLVKEDDHRSAVARAELDKALASIPHDETDADYLVGAMRAHFKGAFTDADEAKVREAVAANAAAQAEARAKQEAEERAAADAKAKQEAEEQAARDKAAAEAQATKDEEARLAAEEASRREAEERAAAEAAAAAEKEKAAAEAKTKAKGKGA